MAALQTSVGGLPHSTLRRSFVEVLASRKSTTFQNTPQAEEQPLEPVEPAAFPKGNLTPPDSSTLGTHKGFPAIFIKDSHWKDLAKPFHWTLVGKFSQGYNKRQPELGRPPVENLKKFFQSLDLKGELSIGLLDNRHLLIQLASEEDFLRLYSRMIWNIGKITMRIFKWVPDFHVDKESSLVPVWVDLPRLPIHLFEKNILFQISSLIGIPLRLDSSTVSLKRPSVARLQVELDLLKSRPQQIWIGYGEREGFWQKVEYENVPSYCKHCWHVGHEEHSCRDLHPELKTGLQDSAAILKPKHSLRAQPQKVYVPKNSGVNQYNDPLDASTKMADTVNELEQQMHNSNGTDKAETVF